MRIDFSQKLNDAKKEKAKGFYHINISPLNASKVYFGSMRPDKKR
jgi:hypothetical protein